MFKTFKDDSALWEDVRNDNEQSFNVLFKRYWSRLYKIAFYDLRNEEDSLEIVHDIFISLWIRRHELEIELFSNYLLMAVRYQIYSRLKPQKLSIVYKADLEDLQNLDHLSELNYGEAQMNSYELQRKLNFHIHQLPKRCQEIFTLSRVNHLSNHEIAKRLGISKKTVENQLTAALKHLRSVFKHIASIVIFLYLTLNK